MNLDEIFETMWRQEDVGTLDSDAIVSMALARRATRLSPAIMATAGAFALVIGVGAGIGGAQSASASPALVPFAYSPSNMLLGD
jgi:hypothetical protein